MNYAQKVREITIEKVNLIKETEEEIKRLKSMKEGYYQPTYESMMQALEEKKEQAYITCKREVEELAEAEKQEAKKRYMPKAEELTADAEILKSGVELDEEELRELFNKYAKNNTMKRIIGEYAEKKDFQGFEYDRYRDYEDAIETMKCFTRNCLQRPDYMDIFGSEEYFNNACPDLLRDVI